MDTRFYKWFVYTVLIGLVPVLCRLCVWLVTKDGTVDVVAPADFVMFGLVLHIAIINEMEHLEEYANEFKTFQNGISGIFLIIYGLLFAMTLLPNLVDLDTIQKCLYSLSFVSFLLGFSVFYRRKAKVNYEVNVV